MDDPVQQLCSGVGRDQWSTGGRHSIGSRDPRFLAFLVVYVLLVIREHRPAALSIILLGIGIAVTGLFPSYAGLLATTLLMSFGFHYFETVNQSLALQYSSKRTLPLVFGRLRSLVKFDLFKAKAVSIDCDLFLRFHHNSSRPDR